MFTNKIKNDDNTALSFHGADFLSR